MTAIWNTLRELLGMATSSKQVECVFKPEWKSMLAENVPLYSRLPEELRQKLHLRIARFVASTRFEGCNHLELTEEMILTVAAQACMLVLHRDGEPYPKLKNVYLYPTAFVSPMPTRDHLGVVTEGGRALQGESWDSGTVILAWDSVAHGARNIYDGHNVTFHEFAHQLDHEDGPTDGAPALPSRAAYRSWAWAFRLNYQEFEIRLQKGQKTLMDPYGATNPAEFFAVATETFFEKPRQMAKKRPQLYDELKEYYGVDPQEWY